MSKKPGVSSGLVLKNLPKLLAKPWMLTCLAGLEADKLFFDLWHRNAREGKAGKIRQLSVRITDRCNLRCHTCGQWGDQGFLHGTDPRELRERELPPGRYRILLDDLAAHGHRPTLYLWGGEPMLYPGTLDTLEQATRLHMPTLIATNGTGLQRAAARLAAMPMFLLQISVDGHSAEAHNAARPAAGGGNNFRDILEGLEALGEEKKRLKTRLPLVAILTTISRANSGHLVDIYEKFHDKADLFVLYLSWWIDEARARAHDEDFFRRFAFTPKLHWSWIGEWVSNDFGSLSEQLREITRMSAPLSAPAAHIMPGLIDR